jgi:MHS family proline/betaine transporter-like MFS transporter
MHASESVLAKTDVRRATVAASVGTMIEAYDVVIYGFFAVILAEQFFPRSSPTAALLNTFAIYAGGFAIRPLGGLAFGHIGDRLGRRPALVGTLLLMAVASAGIALLPTYRTIGVWAPLLLLICRLVQGFAIGGESAGANLLILEQAPAGSRGRFVSINQIAGALALAAAATTSFALASLLSHAQLAAWGWRLPFLTAFPLALVGLYIRLRVAESPAFHAAPARPAFPLVAALREARWGMLVLGGWLAANGLASYLIVGYMPTYLIRVVGLSPAGAFGASLAVVIVTIAGSLVGGYLVDRHRPWLVAAGCATGMALTAVPGFLITQRGGVAAAIVGQAVFAAFVGGASTVSAMLSLLLFPVHVRYTAVALTYQITLTLVGGTAPYVSTLLVTGTNNPIAPAWYLVGVALISLATAVLGVRPRLAARAQAADLSR